jgi:ribosomal-protein-alanine N-acetyltransferase
MHFIMLDTPRLKLRALTQEVYDYVFIQYDTDDLLRFFGCDMAGLAEERRKQREGLAMYGKSLLIFQLIEKKSDTVVGWCGFHTWYLSHSRAEIGYVLTKEESKRKGYMSEALPAVLRYGFEVIHLKRIEALVGPDNVASLKLIRSMGFRPEGVLREHYFTNGRFEDSLVFALLSREFARQTEGSRLTAIPAAATSVPPAFK